MPDQWEKEDARDSRLSGPKTLEKRIAEGDRKRHQKKALEACKVEAAAYVECGKGRTISLPFYCRTFLHDLNECLKKQSPDFQIR